MYKCSHRTLSFFSVWILWFFYSFRICWMELWCWTLLNESASTRPCSTLSFRRKYDTFTFDHPLFQDWANRLQFRMFSTITRLSIFYFYSCFSSDFSFAQSFDSNLSEWSCFYCTYAHLVIHWEREACLADIGLSYLTSKVTKLCRVQHLKCLSFSDIECEKWLGKHIRGVFKDQLFLTLADYSPNVPLWLTD